jgi:carbonic anhydrase
MLACMDARLSVDGILGLGEEDAHIIRNAGRAVRDAIGLLLSFGDCPRTGRRSCSSTTLTATC